MAVRGQEPPQSRAASRPRRMARLPARALGGMRWVWSLGGLSIPNLARRVWDQINLDDVFGRAAQLSFYFILSLFPLLIFLSVIAGYFFAAERQLYIRILDYLATAMPESAFELVRSVLHDLTEGAGGGKLSLGLLFALWTASLGLDAVIKGLNVAYGIREFRPWWKRRLLAMGLTFMLSILILTALVLVLIGREAGDLVASQLHLGPAFRRAWPFMQWSAVVAFVMLGCSLVYLVAPNVKQRSWQAILPGALIAVTVWIAASLGFKTYLTYFDSYATTYGSIGAVIVLLMWLYFGGLAILVGGEVNSEIRKAAAEAGSVEAQRAVERRAS
jgi:membrane protein